MEKQDKEILVDLYLSKGEETFADAVLCIENTENKLEFKIYKFKIQKEATPQVTLTTN